MIRVCFVSDDSGHRFLIPWALKREFDDVMNHWEELESTEANAPEFEENYRRLNQFSKYRIDGRDVCIYANDKVFDDFLVQALH